jgi:uncharacterized protein (TIGR03084 family)
LGRGRNHGQLPRHAFHSQQENNHMLQQIADFRSEADDLHTLLVTLKLTDWQRETQFKSWSINDIVQHLHETDLLAAASANGPEHYDQARAETQALRDSGMTRQQATRQRLIGLTGPRLLERWYTTMTGLCEKLSALPTDTRLKWGGPDMGVRMFSTARQMEIWAHGQAIYDLLGIDRQPTNRLRNIAEIGARTYGWTFANRKLSTPGSAPYIRLTAPDGAIWEWNNPSAQDSVRGDALPFCQVVTQVRNVADTDLTVIGDAAGEWMRIAQCFAGPPEDPPAPGTRVPTRL